jgi:outer membrane protein TolC
LVALGWPTLGWAEDIATILSWQDCVSLALSQNPDLESSRKAEEAGRASYRGSFNGLLPQVALTNSLSRSGGAALSSSAGGFATVPSQNWQAEASANLNIFNASQIATIKTSAASLATATASLRQASATLRYNLRAAFLQLLFAQENVDISHSIIDIRARSAKLLNLRYESGNESRGNMLSAQAELTQAKVLYEQALADLRTSQKALDQQLGQDDFRIIVATGTLDTGEPPPLSKINEAILSNLPAVAVQEAAVKSSEAALEQSRSSLFPSLSASYTRSRGGSAEFPAAQYGWSLGGVLSYPLFSGGPTSVYYAVSAAKRGVEEARANRRSVRNAAAVSLENTWTNWFKATGTVKVGVSLLEAARQRNIEADVRYDSGLLTYDNWEIISTDRITQERQLLSDRLNAAAAEAAWKQALGKGLGE